MIVTSEAIVLRARKHGETSKIVTLYTRDFGKLNVIAKGAREVKSKFGGALEMFAYVSAVFYKKEKTEGLYLLSKSDLIASNSKVMNSLDRIEAATHIIELLIRSMHDEEENQPVFELVTSTIATLASVDNNDSINSLLIRFYLEFARIAGFNLQLLGDEQLEQEASRSPFLKLATIFIAKTGEIKDYLVDTREVHQPMFRDTMLTPEARQTLQYLQNASLEKATALRISERTRTQLIDLFQSYFEMHLDGISSRTMKSGRVWARMKRDERE